MSLTIPDTAVAQKPVEVTYSVIYPPLHLHTHMINEWGKAVRPLLDEYVNSAKAKALPGDEALKYCLDYLKKF